MLKKKVILTQDEIKKIEDAVAQAELRHSGEIVTAIIPESSNYAFYELVSALFAGLLSSLLLFIFKNSLISLFDSHMWLDSSTFIDSFIWGLSVLVGGAFYFISNIPAIDRFIVPRRVMMKEVFHRSMRCFTESSVYYTKDHTGILIFISLLERRVELLADRGISEKIPQEKFDSIVSNLSAQIGNDNLVDGLIAAIAECSDLVEVHFPIQEDDVNELPNQILILEE